LSARSRRRRRSGGSERVRRVRSRRVRGWTVPAAGWRRDAGRGVDGRAAGDAVAGTVSGSRVAASAHERGRCAAIAAAGIAAGSRRRLRRFLTAAIPAPRAGLYRAPPERHCLDDCQHLQMLGRGDRSARAEQTHRAVWIIHQTISRTAARHSRASSAGPCPIFTL